MNVLKSVKRLLLKGGQSTGLAASVRDSEWRRRRLAILCYHGVSIRDEHDWDSSLFVSQEFFRSRMEHLRMGGYRVLPLEEAVTRLTEGTLPEKSVAITFDDGNADFALRASPILQAYGYPATVYLTTFYCGRNEPVPDVTLQYLLWRGAPLLSRLAPIRAELGLPRRTPDTVPGAARELQYAMKSGRFSAEEKQGLLGRIASALELDYDALLRSRILQIMTPEEATAMSQAGFALELHTHRHRTPPDRALFLRELKDNQSEIMRLTGRPARHFCYPQGWIQSEFLPYLREYGVRSATTTRSGLATADDDLLLLPRIVDHSGLSLAEFEGWLSGVAALLPHRHPVPERAY